MERGRAQESKLVQVGLNTVCILQTIFEIFFIEDFPCSILFSVKNLWQNGLARIFVLAVVDKQVQTGLSTFERVQSPAIFSRQI